MSGKIADGRPESCWRIIGINGDRSCSDLALHTHCRNCPVFAQGGRRLLDRPTPEGYLQFWTGLLAEEKSSGKESFQHGNGFVFRVREQWLALSTSFVKDLTPLSKVRRIPHRSNRQLLGFVNIQGVLRLCVSLHSFLGEDDPPRAEDGERCRLARMVMVEKNGESWVFPVDEVHGLLAFNPENLQNSPVTATKSNAPLTKSLISWPRGAVGLLDEQEVLAAFNRSLR